MKINEDKIRIIFGLKLRQLRQKRNLSLHELADKCGLSPSYLNEIEKGKKYPKAEKIYQLAEVLHIGYDELISLKLERELAPLSELMQSGFLDNIPFDLFGIEQNKVVELFVNAPVKVSAFMGAILDVARNYDVKPEYFYLNVLRCYQEIHNNYFEDIEQIARQSLLGLNQAHDKPISLSTLEKTLSTRWGYIINYETLQQEPDLHGLRAVYRKHTQHELLIDASLSDRQKKFILAKEMGYHLLGLPLTERLYRIGNQMAVERFEQVLCNFKASYFAGALLMPEAQITDALNELLHSEQWEPEKWTQLQRQFDISPATFMYRLTNILPGKLGINELFFLNFNYNSDSKYLELSRELHLGKKHLPHGNYTGEHYCRRWLSFKVFNQLIEEKKKQVVSIQRSSYLDTSLEYIVISMARKVTENPNIYTSITLGFQLKSATKKWMKFIADKNIPQQLVNVTCERCSLKDCTERIAPPSIEEKESEYNRIEIALNKLIAK